MSSEPQPLGSDSKLPTMDEAPPGAPVEEQKQALLEKGADDPKTRAEIRWEGEGGNPNPDDMTTDLIEVDEIDQHSDGPRTRPENEVVTGR